MRDFSDGWRTICELQALEGSSVPTLLLRVEVPPARCTPYVPLGPTDRVRYARTPTETIRYSGAFHVNETRVTSCHSLIHFSYE